MSTRILIVDDEITLTLFLQRYLRAMCPTNDVDTAATAEAAMRCLDGAAYDLVIVDYMLPDATGLTVLQRAQQQSPPAKSIFMTGCATPALERSARDAGAAWLAKPFDLQQLWCLVADRLGQTARRSAGPEAHLAAD